MQRFLPLLILLLILGYACYNRQYRQHSTQPQTAVTPESQPAADSAARTVHSLKDYIVHVINHGSSQLHFKKDEIMEGGYAPREDASGIACYVLTLAKEQCDYPSEAAGYYSSICGGCHGDDGRGLGGTYPDLTRRPLLGYPSQK